MSILEKFENVSVVTKPNVYFDGKVVSYTVHFNDGKRKTLGIIFPGTYKFDTAAPEVMEIISGSTKVRLAGQSDWKTYESGSFFKIPEKWSFEITVEAGTAQYICSFE
ncbi:MAG: pyrimidine/purine nucleoside phosphorylase [Verrucomicrobiota bacterium]|nr:pyrimidine/purine nucleoside phosphorylase [Verrucomicrobiota bacterium]